MVYRTTCLSRVLLAAGALTAALLLSTASAGAHHGWGGYLDQTTEMTGTVESPVSFEGAHAYMKIRTQDGVWDVVLAPPGRTANAGLKPDTLPVGAQVTVRGNRHRDPKKLEIKVSRLTWNERTFDVYPERS